MTSPLVTTVICARNASATIARAVASAAPQSGVLLVDDFSTDDTVARARAAASLDVIRPPVHGPMGQTRQAGLDAVRTPFVAWLDADDELLPDRVGRLVDALEQADGDIAADGVALVDGLTGACRGAAAIPAFARAAPVRLFERMYLPAPGLVVVRTDRARHIGYDAALHGCEDVDFLLRGIAGGARVTLRQEIGCRLHAYPESLSRDRDRQRRMYRDTLRKHAYETVEELYDSAGVRPDVTAWALVSVAMFREEHAAALAWVNRAERLIDADDRIAEPDGPCPYPERWRVAFFRGTAWLLMGHPDKAVPELEQACEILPRPEALNNLGAALARDADDRRAARARPLFDQALAMRPGYVDAQENLASCAVPRVTSHPFRVEVARQDYVARTRPPDAVASRDA